MQSGYSPLHNNFPLKIMNLEASSALLHFLQVNADAWSNTVESLLKLQILQGLIMLLFPFKSQQPHQKYFF